MEICNFESCGEVAERRLAEQRLLERERNYRDIFHNLSDGIYLLEVTEDEHFRYLETNRAFEAMMGVPEDGMLGKTVGDLLRSSGAEASADRAVAKFRRCLEAGSVIAEEITLDLPAGRRILHSTLTPLFDDAGRIDRILSISRDITESKQAERLNDFLGFALDQANDAVFLIDAEAGHRFRYVNDQACRSLGYSREELLNMTVPDIDPNVDLEAAGKLDEQIRKQAFIRFETFHRRKDGQVFPVEISGTDIEHDGQTMGLSIVRDISERKAAEDALRQKDERHRRFFELELVGMAITSPEKGWLEVNDKLCAMLGYTREELLSLTWSELTHPDDLQLDLDQFERMLKGEIDTYTLEKRYVRKDYSFVYANLSIACVRRPDGSIDYVQVLIEDITERKLATEQLKASQKMLAEAQEIAQLGSWDWDIVRDRVAWSEMAFEIYTPDKRPADPGYQEFLQSLHIADKERVMAAVQSAFDHGTPFDIEHRVVSESKGVRTVHAQAKVFRDAQGKPIRMVGTVQDITERKRIELDRKLLTEILEESPDFVGMCDMRGVLGYHNRAARRMVGLADGADVSQLSISDMHPEWVTKLIMETALPIVLEQGVWRGETALLHSDGREISVQQTIMLHRDADGKPMRTSTIMQDITERKHMEEQLKLKEFALDHASDAVYLMDGDGRFFYVNDQAYLSLGCSRDELLGLTPFDIDPDVTPEILRHIKEEFDAQGFSTCETRHKRRDGSVFPVEIRFSSLDYLGQTMDLAFAIDISERKRVEQERQSHLHFFESMDKVNRALQGSNDLETVLNEALDTVLAIFDCDRAFLCHPCDPNADSWSVPFEKTKPEFPGAQAFGMAIPMDADIAKTFRLLLDTDGPVTQGTGNQHPLPKEVSETFGIKSHMAVAVYPKGDKPWRFGIHQCSRTRTWTADEQKLFQEIGRRLADGLTGLLAYRDIQERERKFRTLAESLPDHIARYDRQARLIYANPKLQNLLGDAAKTYGKTPKERHAGGHYDAYQHTLEEVIGNGQNAELEITGVDDGAGLPYYHIHFTPEYGPDGEIVGALAIGRDVTRKRQLELELIRSEREFRTLAENSPDSIIRYDSNCRRTYVNRAYEIATNTRRAEIVGKTPLEEWRLSAPNADQYTEILRRVMATGKAERMEVQLFDTGGSPHYFSMHFVPEYDEQDHVNGVLSFAPDITELKTAERRRVEAREDERKLLARELHDDLGQRLTALRLDIALLELRFGKGSPELLAKIKGMDAAVGETIKIIRSLLTMLRPAVLDLGLISAMEWLASEFRKRTQVECSLQLPEQTPVLSEAQSIAIFRIVQESLTNIVKYAQARKVSITLSQQDDGFLLEIQDDGKGFDPGTFKKTGSFGLKGIEERVQMLGGKLSIASAPGRGVKLTVRLPQ